MDIFGHFFMGKGIWARVHEQGHISKGTWVRAHGQGRALFFHVILLNALGYVNDGNWG